MESCGAAVGHGERSRLQLLFKFAGTEKWLLTCWLSTFYPLLHSVKKLRTMLRKKRVFYTLPVFSVLYPLSLGHDLLRVPASDPVAEGGGARGS